MHSINRRTVLRSGLTSLLLPAALFSSIPASAQESYPSKPVKIIVPYAAGGSIDTLARLVAVKLQAQLGQPVIVENRGGGSGTIGSLSVSKAPADGYTLLFNASSQVYMPLVVAKPPYDVEADFTPIARAGHVPLLVVVHPSVPASTLKEFIQLAKANPNKYEWGTSGFGTSSHLAEASITYEMKLEMPIIGYKGAGPQLLDIMGGHVAAAVSPMPGVFPHVQSGKLKAIATTNSTRLPQLPSVPTVAESGMPNFELLSWYGLWGPPSMSADIVNRLSTEMNKAFSAPDLKVHFQKLSFEPAPSTPSEFKQFVAAEIKKIGKTIKDASIRVEF